MNSLEIQNTVKLENGFGYIGNTNIYPYILMADKVLNDEYSGKLIRKICVSLSSGCGIGCIYCFTNGRIRTNQVLSSKEIKSQVRFVFHNKKYPQNFDEIKVSLKQMGDPLLNPNSVIESLKSLHEEFPEFNFVVSTSGPKFNLDFFDELNRLSFQDHLRLQFSCHTTSDKERKILIPKVPIMTLEEISNTVSKWSGDLVTLNFMMLKGYTYDINTLKRLFDPGKVFIKINYVDHNKFTTIHNLIDMDKNKVEKFTDELEKEGFRYAYRLEKKMFEKKRES